MGEVVLAHVVGLDAAEEEVALHNSAVDHDRAIADCAVAAHALPWVATIERRAESAFELERRRRDRPDGSAEARRRIPIRRPAQPMVAV